MQVKNQLYFLAIDNNDRELLDIAITEVDPRDNWEILYYAMSARVDDSPHPFTKILLKYCDDTIENCRLILLFACFTNNRRIVQKYFRIIMNNNEPIGLRDIPIDGLREIKHFISDSMYESLDYLFAEGLTPRTNNMLVGVSDIPADTHNNPCNFYKNLMFFTASSWICLTISRMIEIMCNEAGKTRNPSEYFSAIIYLAFRSNPYSRGFFMRLMKAFRVMIMKKTEFAGAILCGIVKNLQRYADEYREYVSEVRKLTPRLMIGQLAVFAYIPIPEKINYGQEYQSAILSALTSPQDSE